jgi:hypothetical protein
MFARSDGPAGTALWTVLDPAHLHTDILKTRGDALLKMSTSQWNEMMRNATATQRRRASQLMLQMEGPTNVG